MENEKYLNDISEIKNLMNKSSRFISLSGLSGILAGVYAIVGAWLAYKTIYFDTSTMGAYRDLIISEEAVIRLLVIATAVLINGSLLLEANPETALSVSTTML